MRWSAFPRFAACLVGAFGAFIPGLASARAPALAGASVTLSATVLEHCGIILDQNGHILEIYSNTDNDVAPTVVVGNYSGPAAPLTPQLKQNYEQIMRQVTGDHALTIKRAKETLPANLLDPNETVLYAATPAGNARTPAREPVYFVRLTNNKLLGH